MFFRPLSPEALERVLQQWTQGRESKVWLSIDIVLGHCPEISIDDFKRHAELCAKSAQESGFHCYIERRKLHSIFIIDLGQASPSSDRKRKLIDAQSSPVDIRTWKQFLDLYRSKFEVDSELFLGAVFEPRECWLRREKTSLAESVFGITESRLSLTKILRNLASGGLLPQPEPGSKFVGGEAEPVAGRGEQSPPARATRLSSSKDDLMDGLEEGADDSVSLRVARGLISSCDDLCKISDGGNIYMLLVEEIVLSDFLHNEKLVSASREQPERVFETMLADALKQNLEALGPDFPAILLSEASKSTEAPAALGASARLLRHSELRLMFMRYTHGGVGKCYVRDRERRLSAVNQLKASWYSKQLFRPPRNSLSLLEYLRDGAHYRSGLYMITSKASLLRRQVVEPRESAIRGESRSSFESHKRALTSVNEFNNRILLSHRTIFLFIQ
jgi:hypothetical protein